VEYTNELVEEGIGKLVYVRAIGAGEGPDQEHLQGLIEDPSKAILRRVEARTQETLVEAIGQSLDVVSRRDALGWFSHCGHRLIDQPA
jgi:hypothetical protein